ncbi:protein of unknown function (plasmid) [Caballeronia sp. S22]
MDLIIVSFEDIRDDPAGARADAEPAAGFPDSWLDALIGAGSVFSRDYAALCRPSACGFPALSTQSSSA